MERPKISRRLLGVTIGFLTIADLAVVADVDRLSSSNNSPASVVAEGRMLPSPHKATLPAETVPTTTIYQAPSTTTTTPPETTTTTTQPPEILTAEPTTSPSESILPAAEAPLAELQPCPVEWEVIKKGICYAKQEGFHILRVDLTDPNISVCPAYTVGPGRLGGVSEAAEQMDAVAAVNSSFFTKDGWPLGPLACNGQWVSDDSFSQEVLEYHTDGTTQIRTAEETLAADVTALRFAVSGSHYVVNDGQVGEDFGPDNETGTLYGRHNRTAIGIDDKDFLFMAVTERDNKVTMPELAQFMGSLGTGFAINVDGGGSSQLYLNGESLVYSNENERRISTGLFVIVNS